MAQFLSVKLMLTTLPACAAMCSSTCRMAATNVVKSKRAGLSPIANVLQVGPDELVKFGGLLHLPAQLGGKAGHLLFEGLAVILDRGCANVPTGSEDVAVMADLVQGGGFAEAGDIFIPLTPALSHTGRSFAAPSVVGVGDPGDIVIGQVAMDAIDQCAELAGVDEQSLAAAIPETTPTLAIPRQGGG